MKEISSKKTLLVVFLTVFLDLLGVGIIIPVLAPLILRNETVLFTIGTSDATIKIIYGVLLGIYSLAQFFSNPIIGALSDKVGRRKILIYSLIITIIGYMILTLGIFYSSLLLVFLGRIIPGLASGNLTVVYSALADVSDQSTKTKNFGLVGMAFGLGFVIGPFLGGILSNNTISPYFNYYTPFIAAALLSGINLLLAFRFFPETLKERKVKEISFLTGARNIRKAFTFASLRNLFIITFINTFGFSFFTQFFIVILVSKFNYYQHDIGVMYAYLGIWVAISQGLILRPLANRLDPSKIILIAFPMLVVSMFLLLIPNDSYYLYFIIPFIAFSQSSTNSSIQTIISNLADKTRQGEILGISTSMNSLSQAVPALIGGFIVAAHISYPIVLAAISALIAYMLFIYTYSKRLHLKVLSHE